MAQFGSFKFGAAKFGTSILVNPFYALEVDWDRDGLFDGSVEPRLVAWGRKAGRRYTITPDGQSFEEEETGRYWFLLRDPDRRYDPRNASSPLYPLVSPGAEWRFRVRSTSDTVYALGRGFVTNVVSVVEKNQRYVRLDCKDLWSFLRLPESEVSIDLQQNVTASDAIALVLDRAEWRWGRSIEDGVDSIPYWWASDKSAARAIHEVGLAELGKVYIDATGTLNFENRYGSVSASVWIGDDDVVDGTFIPTMPWDVIKNRVSVRAQPRQVYTGVEVWKLTGTITLAPGEETDTAWCRYTYLGEDVAAVNGQAPVATTDYTANSQADGLGTDLTASLQVQVYFYATQAAVTWKNTGASTLYVTMTRLLADAIASAPSASFVSEDAASQVIYQRRALNLRSEWYQNVNQARLISQIVLEKFKEPHDYFAFRLMPSGDLVYQVDLGQRYDIVLDSEGIYGSFRIIQVEQSVDMRQGGNISTTLFVEPYEAVENNAQLPAQIPFQI